VNAFLQGLVSTDIYKRSQGRIARQVTWGALALTIAMGCYRLTWMLIGLGTEARFGIPMVLLLAGLWIAYRLVNLPSFADFLIAVEAEMNKVSWPTRHELIRASLVVLLTMGLLTLALYVFDIVWWVLFVRIL